MRAGNERVFAPAVSVTYILTSNEGFRIDWMVSCAVGIAAAAALLGVYLAVFFKRQKTPQA